MCTPTIGVAMAISATMTAVQGGSMGDIVKNAAIAGATAYAGGELFGQGGSLVGGDSFFSIAEPLGNVTIGAAAVGAGNMFSQPALPTFQVPQQTAQVQQFNSQQSTVTGSGGRQASASLAEAIQRSKQRKLTQEDVGDLSIDTSAFASTGLQLA